MIWKICLWCCAALLCCGCQRSQAPSAENANAANANAATQQAEGNGAEKMTIKLTSSAFQEGGMIPAQYTCDGKNISPPLAWNDVPADVKTLALIADDPDAPRGTWVHWVSYNLPAATKERQRQKRIGTSFSFVSLSLLPFALCLLPFAFSPPTCPARVARVSFSTFVQLRCARCGVAR